MTGQNVVETSQVKISIVSDVINFKALENPPWRNIGPCPSTQQMVEDILEFQRNFENQRKKISNDDLRIVKQDLLIEFIFRLNLEEDHGLGTREETKISLDKFRGISENRDISVAETETLNIYRAYQYLEDIVNEEYTHTENLYGFIESSIVKELHKIILSNIPLPNGLTKPGVCSNKERFTTFQGEIYHYRKPKDMDEALNTILDQFNSLLNWVKDEKDELTRTENLFKTCSWLLFELLDLHPFADGNGRLFRLLCSYVLSLVTPFPTPVYNIWCDTGKDKHYCNALVNARSSPSRHPEQLTTMIIESNWKSWKEFLEKLKLS